eukprot:2087029-Prymnesium_polylepis.1
MAVSRRAKRLGVPTLRRSRIENLLDCAWCTQEVATTRGKWTRRQAKKTTRKTDHLPCMYMSGGSFDPDLNSSV